jgi:hypothetical protein
MRPVEGVYDCAHTSEHRATEDGRLSEGQILVNFNERVTRNHRALSEGGNVEVVMDWTMVIPKPDRTSQQRARRSWGRTGFAQRGTALGARGAVATARHEHHDHVISHLEIINSFAERFDHARSLVTERHWQRPRAITVDHRQVRMA